jgi:hypothetical protein
MFVLFPTERLKMSNFDFSVPTASKISTPDWLADEFQAMLDEMASRNVTMYHTPSVVSVANGVQYAICANCEQNVEAWFNDDFMCWGNFGVRVEFANGAMLNKVCKM